MRKIFTFLCAALMSVSMFAEQYTIPSDNVLRNYYNNGDVCVCIYVPADMDCNNKVLTGSFNGWSTTNCPVFEAVEGYDGWYVASFEPEAEPDESKGMQAKPVMLSNSGAIDMNYQVGAATAIRGGVEVQQGAVAGEIELINYGADAPNVYFVDAWKNNPCTAQPATYTLQLVADPEKGSVAVTNLLGSDIIDNGNGNYTVPENAEVTILATPLEGYEFTGWKVGNIDEMVGCYYCGTALNTEDNPYTFTMTDDMAYLAEFEAAAPADPNREYLSLDPSAWGWGYNSVSGTVADGLQTTIISDWGAVSMGWDPERDLTEWDKIVFEVSHMEDCAGEWWKLKAYLRDESDTDTKQMEGFLGLDAVDNELNYLVIDLHQQVEGFDLTKARVLAVQCEPTGGIFTISSAYLLKENHEGIESTAVTEKATKRIVNGQLLIEKNGKFYNALGAEVK